MTGYSGPDRRLVDQGPPQGQEDRRKSRGRRRADYVELSLGDRIPWSKIAYGLLGVGVLIALIITASNFGRTSQSIEQLKENTSQVEALSSSTAEQRAEGLRLVCTHNEVIVAILEANPGTAGAQSALDDLRTIDCQKLLEQADQTAKAGGGG